LIATDVAARGLDIPAVDLIINLQPPKDTEAYIHRSGRTGRAGRQGMCVTVYSPRESFIMRALERAVGIKFKRLGVPSENQITSVSHKDIQAAVGHIHPGVLPLFEQTAQEFIRQSGDAVVAVSKLMARISGVTTPFNPRSLLTGDSKFTTVLLKSKGSIFHNNNTVEDLLRKHTSGFGEVAAGADPSFAVADVRTADVEKLQQTQIEGVTIEPCAHLPDLKEPMGTNFSSASMDLMEGDRGGARRSSSFSRSSPRPGGNSRFGSDDRSSFRGGDRFGSRDSGDRHGSGRDSYGSGRDSYGSGRDSYASRDRSDSGRSDGDRNVSRDRNGGDRDTPTRTSLPKDTFDAHFDRLFGSASA